MGVRKEFSRKNKKDVNPTVGYKIWGWFVVGWGLIFEIVFCFLSVVRGQLLVTGDAVVAGQQGRQPELLESKEWEEWDQ